MNFREQTIKKFLINNGIHNQDEVNEIVDGFDLRYVVYIQQLLIGDIIYQYVHRPPSYGNPFISLGRWFSLRGATMNDLAISSGGQGRILTKIKVNQPIVGLEGTAKNQPHNWMDKSQGKVAGEGGATQIFIPKKSIWSLEVLGIIST